MIVAYVVGWTVSSEIEGIIVMLILEINELIIPDIVGLLVSSKIVRVATNSIIVCINKIENGNGECVKETTNNLTKEQTTA